MRAAGAFADGAGRATTRSASGRIISRLEPAAAGRDRHPGHRLGRRDHRLGELRPRRCRRAPLRGAGAGRAAAGAGLGRDRLYLDPRHLFVFDEAGRLARRRTGQRRLEDDDAWHASRSTISLTPTGPIRAEPTDYALKEINHVWEQGGAYALLGPSGCGKTTLLNIISGLVRPTRGRVLFDDRDVTDLPTEARNIAQVFQFPVVYDTMTVAREPGLPAQEPARAAGRHRRPAVEEIARLLDLDPRARPQGAQPDRRHEAEDLARPRAGALTTSPRSCSTSRSPSSTRI